MCPGELPNKTPFTDTGYVLLFGIFREMTVDDDSG